MEAEYWQKVAQILEEARERDSNDRARFLDQACQGNTDLRREVESLLRAGTQEGNFLERPVLEFLLPTDGRLGPYRIEAELGEGGMGKVFLAQQTAPIQRKVAIKFIHALGLDVMSRQRFEVEQQLLARMNHSYIAKLFQCRHTEAGLPYFVMEYVHGQDIATYCRKKKLNIRDRLQLFMKVCEAVSHAHLKGIVHRDLKPSNILVIEENDQPIPKLIDFGIAKPLTRNHQLTRVGDTPGTLRYMSPEQAGLKDAQGRPLHSDWRTDVYALGVVLYVLLVGMPPLSWSRQTPIADIYLAIREQMPATPFRRWQSLSVEHGRREAANRGTTIAKLGQILTGDLSWIAMKALAKQPDQRYSSPVDLLRDLECYAKGLPVSAGPPGRAYVIGKFIKRNRLNLVMISLALALSGFFMTTLIAQHQATRKARLVAEQDRHMAEQVTAFLIDIFHAQEPDLARGAQITAKELLDRGAEKLENQLSEQPEIQSRLLETMGKTYQSLGLHQDALPLAQQSLAIRESLLPKTHPDLARGKQLLAEIHHELMHFDTAHKLYRETLEILDPGQAEPSLLYIQTLNALGLLMKNRGDLAAAEQLYLEARENFEKFPKPEDKLKLVLTNNLAALYRAKGDYMAAEPLYRQSLAMAQTHYGENHTITTTQMNGLGIFLHTQGELEEAEQHYRKALAIRRNLLGEEHPWVGLSMNNLGGLLYNRQAYREAELMFRRALEIRRQQYDENHPIIEQTIINLYRALRDRGAFSQAEKLLKDSLSKWREHPGENLPSLIIFNGLLAELYGYMKLPKRAEQQFHNALELARPQQETYALEYSSTLFRYGEFQKSQGDLEACLTTIVEVISQLTRAYPGGHRAITSAKGLYIECLRELGHFQEAETLAWEIFQKRGNKKIVLGLIQLYQDWKKPVWAQVLRDLYCERWPQAPIPTRDQEAMKLESSHRSQ